VGVALGGLGSDTAIEAADMVIMEDRLDRIALGIDVAQKTRRKVIQNTVGALGLKGALLVLGAVGLAGIWAAVFADVGVALLAVINSASLLRARTGK
ncbi:MAG: heavy metal translocating P-type ATPase, partial [Bacillota bacterium]